MDRGLNKGRALGKIPPSQFMLAFVNRLTLLVDEGPTLEFKIKYLPNEAELHVHIVRCTVSI